ncbi:MAG: SPOR domain-containing protein [Thiolinea sp.]
MWYPLLTILIILNVSLFAANVILPGGGSEGDFPATEPGIKPLELVANVIPASYSSSNAGGAASCYTIGPYATERAAQLVMAKIRNYGLAVQMRKLQTLETLNYLVYIPAQASQQAAQAIVDDISRYDVKKHLIIDDGPYKNAISLGFFNTLEKAKRHTEYIRYLGYDARYVEQTEGQQVFWLDYDEPFGSNTPVMAWSKSVDSSSSLQMIPRACR